MQRQSQVKERLSNCKYGILQDKRVSVLSLDRISEGSSLVTLRAIGALLTFDITSRESFDAIHGFVEETTTSASTNLVIILIGNKSDLASERQVSKEEAETYAKRLGLIYIEVSAKTGHNVNLSFDMVTEKVLEKIEKKEIIPEDEVAHINNPAWHQDRFSLQRRKRLSVNKQPEASSEQRSMLWRKLTSARQRALRRRTLPYITRSLSYYHSTHR